jgi:hypothetical protein
MTYVVQLVTLECLIIFNEERSYYDKSFLTRSASRINMSIAQSYCSNHMSFLAEAFPYVKDTNQFWVTLAISIVTIVLFNLLVYLTVVLNAYLSFSYQEVKTRNLCLWSLTLFRSLVTWYHLA